ncbi:hypothetical protein BpHYR1_036517 [Brachionus plicatilis]|uniref:Uncharacterized protein n=1 Tax=Brachionus plicatilis TaxID=10195 RepID=A0A3M7SCL5_BRAPC|nr:hypothetical protein BpHYR1_036517 [Brachionus plicatilis]
MFEIRNTTKLSDIRKFSCANSNFLYPAFTIKKQQTFNFVTSSVNESIKLFKRLISSSYCWKKLRKRAFRVAGCENSVGLMISTSSWLSIPPKIRLQGFSLSMCTLHIRYDRDNKYKNENQNVENKLCSTSNMPMTKRRYFFVQDATQKNNIRYFFIRTDLRKKELVIIK